MVRESNPNSLNAQLATTVKKLRTQKGLSQEELALLASVDRTYISGIERARRNITISTLERLIPHLCEGPVAFFRCLSEEIEAKNVVNRPTDLSSFKIANQQNGAVRVASS